jgi:ubiquinone/menaquinone biosynthesis C-methylase UbiE
MASQRSSNEYTLGSSARETDRLVLQGTRLIESTRQLLLDAGIETGMAVLDLGTGAGDVALLARELVGDSGRVLGLDKDEISIRRARERAEQAGFENVSFVEADLTGELVLTGEFDALVGRRVLQYLPERENILHSLLELVRPGGAVAFQEVNTDGYVPASAPLSESYERLQAWANAVRDATGVETRMGSNLEELFRNCGLEKIQVRLPSPALVAPEEVAAALEVRLGYIRSTLPLMRQYQVAAAGELDRAEEYIEAVRREVQDGTVALYSGWVDHCVWAHKPVE